MSAHAAFSPSAAARWLACPGSIAVAAGMSDRAGEDAAQGTVAHQLAASAAQGLDPHDLVGTTITAENFDIEIDTEMAACAQRYAEMLSQLRGERLIETRVTIADDCWGTLDAAVISEDRAVVLDLKYGRGVTVAVTKNPQLTLYALGLLRAYPALKFFTLQIFQPRVREVLTSWSVTADYLREFERNILNPALQAARAYVVMHHVDHAVPLRAGIHCRWCPARATCPELASHAVRMAQHAFGTPAGIPLATLAEVLTAADLIDAWVTAVRREALARAEQGESIAGFKLVPKRAVRSWGDPAAVGAALQLIGCDPFAPRELHSPAQMEKRFGRALVDKNVGHFIRSVSSGVALVAESDPRHGVTAELAAASRFLNRVEAGRLSTTK